MKNTKVITNPEQLVRMELQNAGFNLDTIEVPESVYLLADDIFDMILSKNCGQRKYPVGGGIYVFNNNHHIGFAKANMCSPAIATQAEDLIACGVQELIHIGYAGALSPDMNIGDIVLTDGAFNDTAVARLYGYDCDFIESTKTLTNNMSHSLIENSVAFRRGKHWTTDAGYRETWEQIDNYRKKNALCVEMEGAGLFTIAKYRNCSATAIYIISDTLNENGWNLGWDGNVIGATVKNLLETIIPKSYN
ncbi:MAG: nucleoside phosphorylase [Clostridia bacterium]|nr:nucleoside phosphorylase [Clostridia bacterium]